MNLKINETAAKILVKCGYAYECVVYDNDCVSIDEANDKKTDYWVSPFADTLEGRRQLDVVDDYYSQPEFEWLIKDYESTQFFKEFKPKTNREAMIERNKWCLEQEGLI